MVDERLARETKQKSSGVRFPLLPPEGTTFSQRTVNTAANEKALERLGDCHVFPYPPPPKRWFPFLKGSLTSPSFDTPKPGSCCRLEIADLRRR